MDNQRPAYSVMFQMRLIELKFLILSSILRAHGILKFLFAVSADIIL